MGRYHSMRGGGSRTQGIALWLVSGIILRYILLQLLLLLILCMLDTFALCQRNAAALIVVAFRPVAVSVLQQNSLKRGLRNGFIMSYFALAYNSDLC